MKTRFGTLTALSLFSLIASYIPPAVGQLPNSVGQGVFSCSPAPCILPPTQVSNGTDVFDAPITADPLNPNNLLLGSNDIYGYGLSFYISKDGGSTWGHKSMSAVYREKWGFFSPGNQPMLGFDRNGNAFIAAEYGCCHEACFGLIGFQETIDGVNWTPPAMAFQSGCTFPWFSWLAIDTNAQSPYVNNLYFSTRTLNEPYQNRTQVFVSHSNDGGLHWIKVPVDASQLYPATDSFTNVTTGKDGTVYVTWVHCAGGGPDVGCKDHKATMLFSKSTDGGNTWSPATVIVKVTSNCCLDESELPNTNPQIALFNYPKIAIDNSEGSFAGNLYVTMFTWTGSYLQVQVIHSSDGGTTWSKPVLVAPTNTHDQFFPAVSVSNSGLLGVSWLDRRNDPANVKYQAFTAISKDGGQSFQSNIQLTRGFSTPNSSYPYWMGDYIGNTWADSNLITAWMDDSSGMNMQAFIGGVRLH